MPWKIKDRQISIFKIPKAKFGILEQKNGKENIRTSIFITSMRLCSKSASYNRSYTPCYVQL